MPFPCYYLTLRIWATFTACMAAMMYSAQVLAASAPRFYDVPLPVVNVPATVLISAFAGSLVGMAYTPAVDSRKQLYIVVLANTLLSSWFVVLLPEWRGWSVSLVAQPPFAGVLATVNCFLVPALFKRLPDVVERYLDRIFNRGPQPPRSE